MKNAITTLRIQNFKSIRDVTMQPRRVNIIIGEPNVGKSNVLEAISLLGGMFFDAGRFMDGQVRYESIRNLFYDNDWSAEITVTGEGVGATRLRKRLEGVEVVFGDGMPHRRLSPSFVEREPRNNGGLERDDNPFVNFGDKNHLHELVDKEGKATIVEISRPEPVLPIRKYTFQKGAVHGKSHNHSFLRPPFGDNLLEVIESAPYAFKKVIGQFFTPFGLNLSLRTTEGKLEIQKNTAGVITSIPYPLIADTLQRIIFYLAAIESNTDSVLLFEEPEAHSFPEYVIQLAERIVSSRENQFFVVTHSPYLTTEVLEQMVPNDELLPELAVFVAYYEDYQTKIRQLSDEELITARANGTELFLNLRQFVPGSAEFVPSSGA